MYAELLMEGRVTSEEKRKNYLRVIVDESRRLARLVNNLLDFSRLEQGRKKYRIEALNLSDFLEEFIDAQRMPVEKAGLSLSLRLPAESVRIRFDRDVLEQVLLNLVDNAVKYAAGGKKLVIALQRTDTGWQLSVMDAGPGIPARDHQRIFEKFYRGNDSLTADYPGSGLGLSIARQLMRDMGGDLKYETRPGGGSCFIILIPDQDPGDD
jgi:signal transduction histidine kinase